MRASRFIFHSLATAEGFAVVVWKGLGERVLKCCEQRVQRCQGNDRGSMTMSKRSSEGT
jgi:hypothetical protein